MRGDRGSMDQMDMQLPDPDPVDINTEKAFEGHTAISIGLAIVWCIIFGIAMAFDPAFFPLFVPTFLFLVCWFRSFRSIVNVNIFAWYYTLGFLPFGLGIVLYQFAISLILGGILPHDSTLSQKYVLSNFMYSFLGGGLGSEIGRYLLSKKIRVDRKEVGEITTYLFAAMTGNIGATTLIMLLGNTGSLLKRVDTSIVETFVLGKAVLVRSILDSILQLLLAYRLELTILRVGYYDRQSATWNAVFASNIVMRGIGDFCFFVIGLMNGSSGAGGLSAIYLVLIGIAVLLVRRERKALSVVFDSSLEQDINRTAEPPRKSISRATPQPTAQAPSPSNEAR
jgi:hypothetical protein